MKQTIFNVYVELKSKQQLQRLLNACEKEGLEVENENNFKKCDYFRKGVVFGFCNWFTSKRYTQVTEQEFIELLNEYKNKEK